jgi:hypothetical protein
MRSTVVTPRPHRIAADVQILRFRSGTSPAAQSWDADGDGAALQDRRH